MSVRIRLVGNFALPFCWQKWERGAPLRTMMTAPLASATKKIPVKMLWYRYSGKKVRIGVCLWIILNILCRSPLGCFFQMNLSWSLVLLQFVVWSNRAWYSKGFRQVVFFILSSLCVFNLYKFHYVSSTYPSHDLVPKSGLPPLEDILLRKLSNFHALTRTNSQWRRRGWWTRGGGVGENPLQLTWGCAVVFILLRDNFSVSAKRLFCDRFLDE